jgi:hypothetical protein
MLAGRYENPMPTWFLANTAGLKLPTLLPTSSVLVPLPLPLLYPSPTSLCSLPQVEHHLHLLPLHSVCLLTLLTSASYLICTPLSTAISLSYLYTTLISIIFILLAPIHTAYLCTTPHLYTTYHCSIPLLHPSAPYLICTPLTPALSLSYIPLLPTSSVHHLPQLYPSPTLFTLRRRFCTLISATSLCCTNLLYLCSLPLLGHTLK